MAQQHGERHSGESITYQRIEPHQTISLRCPAQEDGGRLADAHSVPGANDLAARVCAAVLGPISQQRA